MYQSVWQNCLEALQSELPAQQFSMWIRPLQADSSHDALTLFAPNRFVLDWVRDKYLNRINELIHDYCGDHAPRLRFEVGSSQKAVKAAPMPVSRSYNAPAQPVSAPEVPEPAPKTIVRSNVRANYTFDNFVEGKSNQLARAAASQVADNPGTAYNRCFYTVALVWVKLTYYMRLAMAFWQKSPTPKLFICIQSVLYRIW